MKLTTRYEQTSCRLIVEGLADLSAGQDARTIGIHTGFTMEGFPSFGAWTTYALGSECSDLPAFVAINDPRGMARSGKNNFGSGFLPAAFQGTDFTAKTRLRISRAPPNIQRGDDRTTIDLLKRLNSSHL